MCLILAGQNEQTAALDRKALLRKSGRNSPKHLVENLMGKVHRFFDREGRRDHPSVDLPLSREPQTCDDACPGVDQGSVGPGNVSVGVEHSMSLGE